jgi:TonB-linked SusC/RagA family outer membrane protein
MHFPRGLLKSLGMLIFIMTYFCYPGIGQINSAISGTVSDSTGQGISGVNVQLKGTNTVSTTNQSGSYSLTLPAGITSGTLVFSSVGYTTREIPIPSNGTLNVVLEVSSIALTDIVVVGYSTQRRSNLTGAVNVVNSRNIENKPVTNVLQALQGEAPNLIIQQTNLNPGSNVNINIRGLGTLGDNTPLVVIDGIIGGNINTINPNDIASVTVLKDAGSAAIYGSRAANGVLLITTKSGRINQKPTFTYNGTYGVQDPRVLVRKVNAADNAYYKNESLVNSGLPPQYTPDQIQELEAQGNGTWDIEHLLRNAPMQTHNVSVSGGGQSNYYFISAGYQGQGSNFIGNGGSGANFGYHKYNLRLNQTSIIGKFKANIILNYTKSKNKTNSVGDNNIFADANRVPYNYSWKDSAGNYLTNPVASQYNEYGVLEKGGFNQADNDEVFGNLNGQLNITKDLKLTGVFGGTIVSNGSHYRRIQVNYVPAGVYGDDRATLDNTSKSLLMNSQLYAEYNKRISDHSFRALGGASNENYSQKGFQLQQTLTDPFLGNATTGTLVDRINSFNAIAVNQYSLNSIFGRINYSYKDKYLLEGNFRNDASSRFAKGNRAGFFPSINVGWLASEESFMQPLDNIISNLKFRTSYGVLGNQNVSAYQYQTTYFNYASAYGFNANPVGGAGFLLGNPNLTWEKAATLNVGVDAAFFSNTLTLSFDYFNKVTSDILQPRQDVPLMYGAAFPDYNVAKVKNTGWDAIVTYNLRKKAATHNFSFNIGDNKNELLALTSGATQVVQNQDVFSLIRKVGEPITQYYGYKTNGFFQDQADVDRSPKPVGALVVPGDLKFKDLNSDGIIDDKDKTVLGNPFPRLTFGFTYRLTIGGFDAQIFLQGVGKRDAFLRGELVEPFHYNYGQTMYEHLTDYWTPSNPDAKYPQLAAIGSASNNNNWRLGSDIYKYDASYVRLKNINIGYTLPKALTQRWGMERLRVSLIGQNLLTLSNLNFIDPETSEFNNNANLNAASNSARSYPLPVFYGAGLDISF